MIMGLTLNTKQEEMYRAIIEATAFGTRNIIESMKEQGIAIDHIYACGGLSSKSPLVMQIFADVLGREIETLSVEETTAFGAAMYGMVAAGEERGGFDTFEELSHKIKLGLGNTFIPNLKNHRIYNDLFACYRKVASYFGEESKNVMETLKKIRTRKYE